jgi:hypothetical protein
MQYSVGVKNALGKVLTVENGVQENKLLHSLISYIRVASFSKSITQYKAFINQPSGDF